MARIEKIILSALFVISAVGCASSGSHFYDSAMNDHNRAPASLGVPESYEQGETASIDPVHNQAEADFLFLKSEMESNLGKNAETIGLLKNALVYDPESPTLMQKLAVEYYKASKTNEAIEWAERARQKAPDRRDIVLLAAGLHTTNKNFSKAEELYKQLIKKDSQDYEAMLYLGAVFTEQKNFPKAVQIFEKLAAVKNYPSQHMAHYYLARVYAEKQKRGTKQVKEELRKAIASKPDFFEAVSMLGQLMMKDEGKDKAFSFYADYQEKHGPNLKLAEMLSQYYISKGEFDKAYEQLEIVDESMDDMVQVKLKMALILIDKKAYDKAIEKLQQILVIAPESDKVRFYLAAVYEEKRDFKSAYEQYAKIEKSSSYFEDASLHAAYISRASGNLDRAVALLKESIDKKAENPQSYFLLSQVFEDKKDSKAALNVLKDAQAKFPKNPQVFYYLGTLQDKMNLKSDMITSMKQVVELDPEHAQALNYLAYTWAEQNEQLELAETYARKAVSREKEDAFILDTLGWVLFKQGRFKEAIATLEKAQQLQPQVSIILEHLGDIYAKMDQHEKAKEHFLKAVETEADADHKSEIKNKLTQVENKIRSLRVPSSADAGSNTGVSP